MLQNQQGRSHRPLARETPSERTLDFPTQKKCGSSREQTQEGTEHPQGCHQEAPPRTTRTWTLKVSRKTQLPMWSLPMRANRCLEPTDSVQYEYALSPSRISDASSLRYPLSQSLSKRLSMDSGTGKTRCRVMELNGALKSTKRAPHESFDKLAASMAVVRHHLQTGSVLPGTTGKAQRDYEEAA